MITEYFGEVKRIIDALDTRQIQGMLESLEALRDRGGRLFILGVGGSAGNASHAVNDFRKLCEIESYAPTDNVSELTARTNDDGWQYVFAPWLATSHLGSNDAILILSVGGGNAEKNVSANLIEAIDYAKYAGAKVFGIVGRDGGYTAQNADACVIVPTVNPDHVTPHTEAFQAVIWHFLVWQLKVNEGRWESIEYEKDKKRND